MEGGTAEAQDEPAVAGHCPWALLLGLSRCWCWQEPKEAQEAQCIKVQRIGEDPQSYYFPGQFAFIRANA